MALRGGTHVADTMRSVISVLRIILTLIRAEATRYDHGLELHQSRQPMHDRLDSTPSRWIVRGKDQQTHDIVGPTLLTESVTGAI